MIDITQTSAGDIALATGDFVYTESTGQHQRDILLADKGHFKEVPAVGVGSVNFINDDDPENYCRTVRKECGRDGMIVNSIKISDGQLEIEAAYGNNNS